jgi:signal transduction histidine kinase
MRLADFILANLEPLLGEWETFAQSLPVATSMSAEALRDDAERMLRFIAADLATEQSAAHQDAKAKGMGPSLPDGEDSAAHAHGLQRLGEGFSLIQMASEYRALRASVTRLWSEHAGTLGDASMQLIRFNEAMDQLLAESADRFTSKMSRDKDMFLAILGHDLRNPLSAIQMGATVLLRSNSLTARDYHIMETISRSAERMQQMVNDLLDFTRTRLGAKLVISAQRCDLATICRNIAEEAATGNPDRAISADSDGDCSGQWDASRIEQLVSNLVQNAIQHGFRGSPVTLNAAGQDADAVSVSVHNFGPVIPEWRRQSIFDPLTRGVSVGTEDTSRTSLGLGLYIAHQIATAHGGSIEWSSSEEGGTMFRVRLPRQLPATPPA